MCAAAVHGARLVCAAAVHGATGVRRLCTAPLSGASHGERDAFRARRVPNPPMLNMALWTWPVCPRRTPALPSGWNQCLRNRHDKRGLNGLQCDAPSGRRSHATRVRVRVLRLEQFRSLNSWHPARALSHVAIVAPLALHHATTAFATLSAWLDVHIRSERTSAGKP
eukprot:6869310-Prymnesium_polylepis.1